TCIFRSTDGRPSPASQHFFQEARPYLTGSSCWQFSRISPDRQETGRYKAFPFPPACAHSRTPQESVCQYFLSIEIFPLLFLGNNINHAPEYPLAYAQNLSLPYPREK